MAAERRIVLTGIKGMLTLCEQDGVLTAHLAEAPDSVLFLVKPGGGVLRLALHAGQGSLRLPPHIPLPEAVLVEQNGRMLASGGFAGRKSLLSEAQRSARLLLWEEESRSKREAGKEREKEREKEKEEEKVQRAAAEQVSQLPSSPCPQAVMDSAPASAKALERQPLSLPPGESSPSSGETAGAQPSEAEAPYSEAARRILEQAAKLFHPTTPAPPPPRLDPFPRVFPGAVWRRVEYPGAGRYYLEGRYAVREARFLLYALPGEYSPVPPRFLRGYTRFVRGADGVGYWVKSKRVR